MKLKCGLVGIVVTLAACSGENPATTGDGTMSSGIGSAGSEGTAGSGSATSTSSTASTGSSGSSGSGSSGSGSSGSTSGADTSATGSESSASGTGAESDGCRKVDVVFAIDNSGSMQGEIDAFNSQGAFDELVTTLVNEVGEGIEDFHLAVVDACPKPAAYHNYGDSGDCAFSSGTNYMVGTNALKEDPDCIAPECTALNAQYTCVTELNANGYGGAPSQCIDSGSFGDDDEQPAFTAAHSLAQLENTGFLRDDAVLFVVAITDEDEEMLGLDDSSGAGVTPGDVVQLMVDAKGGYIENVVFLGIGGPAGGCSGGPYGNGQDAAELRAITSIFEDNVPQRGMFWNICDNQGLQAAFEEAFLILDSACDEIVFPS